MKRLVICIVSIAVALSLSACAGQGAVHEEPDLSTEKGADLVASEGVARILISTYPESDIYRRDYTQQDKIGAITDYIDGLDLTSEFSDDPNIDGMTWVITYVYEDGTEMTMYHVGNMFFLVDGGEYMRMGYEQSQALSALVAEHPSD